MAKDWSGGWNGNQPSEVGLLVKMMDQVVATKTCARVRCGIERCGYLQSGRPVERIKTTNESKDETYPHEGACRGVALAGFRPCEIGSHWSRVWVGLQKCLLLFRSRLVEVSVRGCH